MAERWGANPEQIARRIERVAPTRPEGVITLDEAQRVAAEKALHAAGGNVSKAAQWLQIDRSTLIRKMDAWGLR